MTSVTKLFALAWRESRTARRRLLLYMSSISLGVAALVALDSFAENLKGSLNAQSRTLLGGDIAFRSRSPFSTQSRPIFDSLAQQGTAFARMTTFASMAVVPK